jgi:hypothetical protein
VGVDYVEALGAAQRWIGNHVLVIVQPVGHAAPLLQVAGVVGTPELLETEDAPAGETWLFPLEDDRGAFVLPASKFVDAHWDEGQARFVISLGDVALELSPS